MVVEVKDDSFVTVDDEVVTSAEGWIDRFWLHFGGGSVEEKVGDSRIGVRGGHYGGSTRIIHDVNLAWTSS